MDFVKNVRDNIPQQTEGIINRNKAEIFDMNQKQIENRVNVDGGTLINSGKFSGFYSPLTAEIAKLEPKPLLQKISGQPYNFVWGGDFASSYKINFKKNAIEIYNTGTGSGAKKSFFDGYNNKLIGLIPENQQKLNYEIIKPELDKYIRQYL